MTLAIRHPLSSGILLLAVLGILATLAVARPRYPDDVRTENVDLAQESKHSVADLKAVFAEQGIALNYTSVASGVTWVGATPPPWSDADLYAMVMPTRGTVGLGHGDWENAYFEQRAGNVIVHYGGSDGAIAHEAQARDRGAPAARAAAAAVGQALLPQAFSSGSR